MTKVAELYGLPTFARGKWNAVVKRQERPLLGRKCLKNRKSEADLTMRKRFAFYHVEGVRDGDAMQFHAYELQKGDLAYTLQLKERASTDSQGVATCLGLQASPKVDLNVVLEQIEAKMPQSTLLTVRGAVPVPKSLDIEADED